MSGRPGQLSRAQQAELGLVVAAAREGGACWKALECRFNCSRTQLWRYVAEAKMKQQKPKMQHHRTCVPLPV